MDKKQNTNLVEAQSVMLNMLTIVNDICLKNNINYWLDGGTLLGAARHQGFIPWDDDIDIAMLREDFNKFLLIANKELPENIFIQTRTNDEYYNITVQVKLRDNNSMFVEKSETDNEVFNQGIFIDIFAYDFLPENKILRNFYKSISKKLCKTQRTKLTYPRRYKSDFKYIYLSKLISNSFINKTLQNLIEHCNTKYSKIIGFGLDSTLKRVYEYEDFFPLIEVEFEGTLFLAPKKINKYLEKTYGDYMTLPPLKEQEAKHYKKLIPKLD